MPAEHAKSKITQGKVKPSTRATKKFMRIVKETRDGEIVKEKTVHFGAVGMTIKKNSPEHKKSYCARSAGQKGTDDPFSANYQSRKMWDC